MRDGWNHSAKSGLVKPLKRTPEPCKLQYLGNWGVSSKYKHTQIPLIRMGEGRKEQEEEKEVTEWAAYGLARHISETSLSRQVGYWQPKNKETKHHIPSLKTKQKQ